MANRAFLTACLASAAYVLLPESALADAAPVPGSPETSAAPTPAADSATTHLEEIIVTAQRRVQQVQKVPITISVIGALQLKSAGISDTTAITAATPGLVMSTNGPSGSVFIRGVGSNAGNVNQEPSVALYVDDVYMASPAQNQFALNNVAQVAVLKGPQGTLFGRNATGGVIQVTTRDPGQTTTVDAQIGYGNFNTVNGSLYAATPLTKTLAIDIAMAGQHQGDGWGQNVITGQQLYRYNDFAVRSKLVWTPDNATTVKLSLDYDKANDIGLDYRSQPGEVDADGQSGYVGFYNSRTNTPSGNVRESGGTSLKIDHDFDIFRFVSITSYRKLIDTYQLDEDKSPLSIVVPTLNEYSHDFTQELQLLSPKGGKFNWVVGAFLYSFEAGLRPATIAGAAAAPLPYIDEFSATVTHSYSLYAQGTYEVLPETHFTGGLRYTIERQSDNDYGSSVVGIIAGPFYQRQSFSKPTWRLALDHQFTPDSLAYVSYNRGIKSGGFDVLTLGSPGYKPEQLDAYEVGVKNEFLDNRVRLNLAAFYYDYKNIQEELAVTGGTITINAAVAHAYGLDADLRIAASPHFTIYGGGSYLHSVYASFPGAQAYPGNPGPAAPDPGVVGKRTTQAPTFTGNIGGTYKIPSPIGDFAIDANLSYNDGFYWDSANRLAQPSYALLNTSLGWTSAGGRFGAQIWAKNLANSHYLVAGITSSGLGDLVQPAAPRTFGGTVSVHF